MPKKQPDGEPKGELKMQVSPIHGDAPRWSNKKGTITVHVDGSNYVTFDAYTGAGDERRQRPESLVTVYVNGRSWQGTLPQLAKLLGMNK